MTKETHIYGKRDLHVWQQRHACHYHLVHLGVAYQMPGDYYPSTPSGADAHVQGEDAEFSNEGGGKIKVDCVCMGCVFSCFEVGLVWH